MIGPKPKLHVDLKWLNQVSGYFKGFKTVRRNTTYCCSCPFCGVHEKKLKRKFYFYVKKDNLNVVCHKCGYSKSFYNFFKEYFSTQFDEYKKETLYDFFMSKAKNTSKTKNKVGTQGDRKTPLPKTLKKVKRLLELKYDDPVRKYIDERKIPKEYQEQMLYTDDFKSVVLPFSDSFKNLPDNDKRIIIPFFNKDGKIKALQGRAVDSDANIRYITVKTSDDNDKIYGEDKVDYSKKVYAVEGPIDSMFIDNCIATCDANLTKSKADVLIWDNEPRHKDIVRYMGNAIDQGRSVVIWPSNNNDAKVDINDLVIKGMTTKQLMTVIDKCTYSGLQAKMKFNEWKKI